jgi:hypothetical protein
MSERIAGQGQSLAESREEIDALGKEAAPGLAHCRFVLPFIHFIPDSLTYSVPLFLKRQCDRTLGGGPARAVRVDVRRQQADAGRHAG